MSATKRLLFNRDRLPETISAQWSAKRDALESRLTVRIPTRRKNTVFGRRWDPLWPSCLRRAADDLSIEFMRVNDGLFVASEHEADRVKARAEALWNKQATQLRAAKKAVEF